VLIPFDLNPNAPTDTIADIVEASGGIFDDNRDDFDILFQALQATDLLDVFDQANLNATVLAPTDQAFVNLAQNLVGDDVTIDTEEEALNAIIDGLNEITDGEAIDAIADVLSYHVLAGQLTAEDIILRGLNFTNLGLPFQVIPNSI
ncbi:MAG: fasciclin domain-containing protein, partial [Pseudomonadota bacterium]